ncbi:hypothetical protein NTCA1_55100 [Novosphingobium sp. TCA1]|nr:hypothetical protein NTCA1_55100 [Novosphingobium sp. TCA1]
MKPSQDVVASATIEMCRVPSIFDVAGSGIVIILRKEPCRRPRAEGRSILAHPDPRYIGSNAVERYLEVTRKQFRIIALAFTFYARQKVQQAYG